MFGVWRLHSSKKWKEYFRSIYLMMDQGGDGVDGREGDRDRIFTT